MLRDLRLWIERDGSGTRTGLELVPGLLGPAGEVHLGVLATLADVAGGELAVRSARPELVRRTRSTIVLEVSLGDAAPEPVALARMTFAVLPARAMAAVRSPPSRRSE